MIAKSKNDRTQKWVRAGVLAAAALAASCGASLEAPYPALGTQPNIWITYPVEANTNVCLSADANQAFPVYFTAFNPPTGSQVKVTLDPHLSATGGTRTAMTSAGRFDVSMAGRADAVGLHVAAVEIVNADGTSLRADQTKNSAAAKYRISFRTRARKEVVAGTAVVAATACRTVVPCTADDQCDPADAEHGTEAQHCVDGTCE